MRRWNGWGDESITATLPPRTIPFLKGVLGSGSRPRDAALRDLLGRLPPSRLSARRGLDVEPLSRLLHARGQSLPDWIALRSGRPGALPDGVAWPESDSDVKELIDVARRSGASLIPYGGGTSVLGHVNPLADARPVLSVDLSRLSDLRHLDARSHLAAFGAGVKGPDLEAALRAGGFTLGHFPQSFEYSTLGGWIATRSSGQQSLGYGRIERLFAGGHLETPAGPLEIAVFSASAAGPDLREIVLGSEGRIGILTEATVRVTPLPEREEFFAVFFPDWENGLAAARLLARPAFLFHVRLATPEETAASLLLAGHERLIGALEGYLRLRRRGESKCLLLVGLSGRKRIVRVARSETLGISRSHGGICAGSAFGERWRRSRFFARISATPSGTPDTPSTPWRPPSAGAPSLPSRRRRGSLREGLREIGEGVHVFSHLSHLYPDGSGLYTTYLFRLAEDPDENLRRGAF